MRTSPTLRYLDDGLKHQRHGDQKDQVVDVELDGAPFGRFSAVGDGLGAGIFGRRGSRVSGGLQRSCGGDGESGVEGIEGIQLSEPR